MCGIIGYCGKKPAAPILLDGLSMLEYRGYDSCGVALVDDKITVLKCEGRVHKLKNLAKTHSLDSSVGIGHTRWATHGKPCDKNAHPFLSYDGAFAVVHNGIIENHIELKSKLIEQGIELTSDTDSEIIAHLLALHFDKDVLSTVFSVARLLDGWFALAIISTHQPDKIYAYKNRSPLIVGKGESSLLCSDVPALFGNADGYYAMLDGEAAVLSFDSISIYNKNQIKAFSYSPVPSSSAPILGESFPHFMLKEIYEQPHLLAGLDCEVASFVKGNELFCEQNLRKIDKIDLIGCGSAYFACHAAARVIRAVSKIPAYPYVAGEYRYGTPLPNKHTLTIAVSQSGETADTIAALGKADALGSNTLALVNTEHSTLARSAKLLLRQCAGPEIAVATTKGYLTQIYALFRLAIEIDRIFGNHEHFSHFTACNAPKSIEQTLACSQQLQRLSTKLASKQSLFIIGRGADLPSAMEGALKIKEITYIHAEAYAASELKHGAIALIHESSVVLALATQPSTESKMLSSVREVKARGATVYAITSSTNSAWDIECDEAVKIPALPELFTGLVTVPALQLLAYHLAVLLGRDVDKPRNLAKSVTVE